MVVWRRLVGLKRAGGILYRRCTQTAASRRTQKPVQEIVIPVPWGHVAGKWWGRTDVQPILGLHGWEDNANTFDTLVPLLNVESFLAIDFVGHGMSSHLPVGRFYNYLDFIMVVRMLQRHFKWQTFSMLGHSLGSSVAFMYAGLYPEAIDRFVSIECAHSLIMGNKTFELKKMKLTIDKSLAIEKKLGKEVPTYELEEMVQMLYESMQHTLSLDACKNILQRGTRKTVNKGKESYHFSRDPRLRMQWLGRLSEDIYYATAERVKSKVLCIRGRWWGPTNTKPILCLHGWQDNAGTWDTLAPLLPADVGLLAFDFPGHGLSSYYPPGQPYYQIDYMAFVRRIVKHYGWQSVSLMGHSLGSIVSFMYACTYPDEVSSYIGIDALEPLQVSPEKLADPRGKSIDKILDTLSLDAKNSPTYTYEEAISVYEKGTNHSLTRESCEVLMKRGTEKLANGRYSFSRDLRLKHSVAPGWPLKNILQFAACVECNVLNIKADQGFRYNDEKSRLETVDVLKKSAKHFEHHVVEGTHHVHVNNPDRVAPLIANFLRECVA